IPQYNISPIQNMQPMHNYMYPYPVYYPINSNNMLDNGKQQQLEHLKIYKRWLGKQHIYEWLDEVDIIFQAYNFSQTERYDNMIQLLDNQPKDLVFRETQSLNRSYTNLCSYLIAEYGESGFTQKRINQFLKMR